jgi:uncharacterized protein
MSSVRKASKRRLCEGPSSEIDAPAKVARMQAFTGPLVVFAHGAGAGSSSGFMVEWSARLSKLLNSPVYTFDFSNMAGQKRGPPPSMPKLVREFDAALRRTRTAFPAAAERGVVLAGKSMGSRVALYLAESPGAAELGIRGCICFGYPIGDAMKANTANAKDRFAVAERVRLPIMFVHGTRDKIATIGRIHQVVDLRRSEDSRLTKPLVVDNGDHSLAVTKSWLTAHSTTQADVDASIAKNVLAFVDGILIDRKA